MGRLRQTRVTANSDHFSDGLNYIYESQKYKEYICNSSHLQGHPHLPLYLRSYTKNDDFCHMTNFLMMGKTAHVLVDLSRQREQHRSWKKNTTLWQKD